MDLGEKALYKCLIIIIIIIIIINIIIINQIVCAVVSFENIASEILSDLEDYNCLGVCSRLKVCLKVFNPAQST